MAILRDRVTSAPIFEGSPIECVLAAEKLGRDEVLFDDVGLRFEPDAVLQSHQESLTSAQQIVDSTTDNAERDSAQSTLDSAPNIDGDLQSIEAALTEARSLVEG